MFEKIKHTTYTLLRKSEKYTKTDMVYLAKGGGWLTLGQVIISIFGLLNTIILANLLKEQVFGTYKVIISLLGIINIFTLTGLGTALTRAIAKGNDGALLFFVRKSIKWNLIPCIVALVLALFYFQNKNNTIGYSLLLMIPFIPILNGLGLYQAFLNGKKDYRFYVIFNSISSFLSLITVFIVATFSQKVTMILLSFLISNSLIQIAGFFLTKYKYKIIEKEDAHDQFTYGKSISIMNILGGISLQIDKILIWHRFGPIDLAIYSIATAPPQQIRYLTKIIGALALPNFTTREVSALQKEMTRKALWLLLLGGSLTLFYILIAPPFFKIFFPKYQDAIIYSQIFSLIFFFFPAILFQTALTAKKQVRPLYIVQTIMPITKILLLFVMIPYFGLVGVFYTIFISELVRLVLVIFFFFRMSKL